jgi:hypothetical protein
MKKIFLLITHVMMLVVGFAAGIYALPILIQPPSPDVEAVGAVATKALFTSAVRRDLKGSDALHYGEGILYVSSDKLSFSGSIAPGPDYRLYLSPTFVETKADFLKHKSQMVEVGEVKTFSSFILELPEHIDPKAYTTAVVWCESFNMFITATEYQ